MSSLAAEIAMTDSEWYPVCSIADLLPNIGARALVCGRQIALFRLSSDDQVYAIDAYDPFSQAPVLSRGIVGDLNGEWVVASPIYKQHFSLRSGQCLEDESVRVNTYSVRLVGDIVEISLN